MTKREFLTAGLALAGQSAASAFQGGKPPTRKAKTTKLFKAPDGFPNALQATNEGLWIGEQKLSGAQAASYKLAEPK